MSGEISDKLKYDPSDIRQTFPDINVRLHCCRYWLLYEWECTKMAFPFWRLYYNTLGNASVSFKGITTNLTSDKVLIIPPNTSYSSSLKGNSGISTKESIEGRKIINLNELHEITVSDHLFIHFNLGMPFDLLEPGIYSFPVKEFEADMLAEIKNFCMKGLNPFTFEVSASIQSLILGLIKEIPAHKWRIPKLDYRVSNAVAFIDLHLDEQISNKQLSDKSNMVENSFARLFKENMRISIQQYIKRKRIDKALILLHHSNISIENIASQCGFTDRFHFSKVFKELMGMSPVGYKKQLTF